MEATPYGQVLAITEDIPAGSYLDLKLIDPTNTVWQVLVSKAVAGYIHWDQGERGWIRLNACMRGLLNPNLTATPAEAIRFVLEHELEKCQSAASDAFTDSLRWDLLLEDRQHNADEAERLRTNALTIGSAMEDLDIIAAALAAAANPATCEPCEEEPATRGHWE